MTDPQPGSLASAAASVDDLLCRWDDARQQGQTISPEELCHDCPQQLAELQSRIDGVEKMERFMAKAGGQEDSLPPSASNAETGFNGPAQKTVEEAKSCLSPPRGPDEIGWLGKYRVLKVLGAGGMGVVLLAEDTRLKRQVAVKVMAPSLAANAAARERFLREAQAAAALEHEHIVAIHQVDEHNNVPYLVMPFLKGESLEDRLARAGRLEALDAVRIGREIAEGLAAAHEHGLIHRDIKPGNIWLETKGQGSGIRSQGTGTEETEIRETSMTSDQWRRARVDRVKILDFGLARAERDDMHLTRTGEVLGTPAYMCPEQAAGEAVDQRGDLFSLGAVLYRMVTGKLPFTGDTIFAMMSALANQQPQAPETLNPHTPPPLSRLILRLLEKERSRRPASALEVANELSHIEATCFEDTKIHGGATQNSATKTLPEPPQRHRPRWRTAIAVGALAVALLVAGIVVIIRDREGNEVARIKVPKGGNAIIEQKDDPPIVVPEKPVAKAKDPHRAAGNVDQGKPFFTNSIDMKLMAIPAGDFLMGSPKDEIDHQDAEGPQHRVVISKPFFMSAHEVTQEQYQKIMGRNPSANKEDPRCPVEQVSWENAVDFCERLSQHPAEIMLGRVYRLPTEAEWEYACRAGTNTPFHFGASLSTEQANFGAVTFGTVEKGAPGKTVKVESFPPNAWGLFDMHGNVREWCLDGSRPFKKTDDGIANPQGPTNDGQARVCRGGHFSTSATGCRSAQRMSVNPLARQPETGFRVVCTASIVLDLPPRDPERNDPKGIDQSTIMRTDFHCTKIDSIDVVVFRILPGVFKVGEWNETIGGAEGLVETKERHLHPCDLLDFFNFLNDMPGSDPVPFFANLHDEAGTKIALRLRCAVGVDVLRHKADTQKVRTKYLLNLPCQLNVAHCSVSRRRQFNESNESPIYKRSVI